MDSEKLTAIADSIVGLDRADASDELVRHTVEKALDVRKLRLKMGSPEELFQILLKHIDPGAAKVRRDFYQDYLRSYVWEIIRDYKIYLTGYQCESCGSQKKLEVHHLTYQYIGREHYHLSSLRVLCRDCHQQFHQEA